MSDEQETADAVEPAGLAVVVPAASVALKRTADLFGDGRAVLGQSGAVFTGDISMEEHRQVGAFLQANVQASLWQLGDWIKEIEGLWSEVAYDLIDPALFDEAQTKQAIQVVKAFPPDARERAADISVLHYVEISKKAMDLSITERLKWVERTIDGGWSPARLGQQLREELSIEIEEAPEPDKPNDPTEAFITVKATIDLDGVDKAAELKHILEADVKTTLESNGVSVRGVESKWLKTT